MIFEKAKSQIECIFIHRDNTITCSNNAYIFEKQKFCYTSPVSNMINDRANEQSFDENEPSLIFCWTLVPITKRLD